MVSRCDSGRGWEREAASLLQGEPHPAHVVDKQGRGRTLHPWATGAHSLLITSLQVLNHNLHILGSCCECPALLASRRWGPRELVAACAQAGEGWCHHMHKSLEAQVPLRQHSECLPLLCRALQALASRMTPRLHPTSSRTPVWLWGPEVSCSHSALLARCMINVKEKENKEGSSCSKEGECPLEKSLVRRIQDEESSLPPGMTKRWHLFH